MRNSVAMSAFEGNSRTSLLRIRSTTSRVLPGRRITDEVQPSHAPARQLPDETLKFCGARPIYLGDVGGNERNRGVIGWRVARYQSAEESWVSGPSRASQVGDVAWRNTVSSPMAQVAVRTSDQRDESFK